MDRRRTDLVGWSVMNYEGEELGEVEEVLTSSEDEVTELVLAVAGGGRDVAVEWEWVQEIDEENQVLMVQTTLEDLRGGTSDLGG